MKVVGNIRGVPVLMLVDSGATHNFISPKVVRALRLDVTPMPQMRIRLGDGHLNTSVAQCQDMWVEIQGSEFKLNATILELNDIDMVLGMTWLTCIGRMWVDWNERLMRFKSGRSDQIDRNPKDPINESTVR
jgi:predicted aspartyl protease